jgi:hypothetical protein
MVEESMIVDEPIELGDDTPPVIEQAKAKGLECDMIGFGKAEAPGIDYFNPGLIRRPDGLWLLSRRSQAQSGMPFGHNRIVAFKLQGKMPTAGCYLKFADSTEEEQFEDPRACMWRDQVWVSCVNFTWYPNGSWTGAHQMLGIFKDHSGGQLSENSWVPVARRDPIIGTNRGKPGPTYGKHNKNLIYFFKDDRLFCLYTSDPWLVVEFGNNWLDQKHHTCENAPNWRYGLIRGGTPPVLFGDVYYTFFHSSLPWRSRYRRYYMGALAFESKPPFKPIKWTSEPILIGSQNDVWKQRKPLVVFPCGAVHENDTWLVTFGVNDLKSAWIEIPHDRLLQLLDPAPVVPVLGLLSDPAPNQVAELLEYSEGDDAEEEEVSSVPIKDEGAEPSAAAQTAEIPSPAQSHGEVAPASPPPQPVQPPAPQGAQGPFSMCECGHPVIEHVDGKCQGDLCDCTQFVRRGRGRPKKK